MVINILLVLSLLINMATPLIVLSKFRKYSVYIFFFYYFNIDYINYLIGFNQGLIGYALKLYPDVFFGSLLLRMFLYNNSEGTNGNSSVKINVFFLGFIGISCAYMVYGVINGNSVSRVILDWRSCAIPILVAFLVAKTKLLSFSEFSRVVSFCAILVVINTLIAIYQYITFNGLAESSWRYNFIKELQSRNDENYEERLVVYQVIRGDDLRASGLFASALAYSYVAGMYCFYFYTKIFKRINSQNLLTKVLQLLAMIICAVGVYVSQVRSAFIIIAFCMICHFIGINRKHGGVVKLKPTLLMTFSLLASFLMFIYLSLAGPDQLDASSYGRVLQYIQLIESFSLFGAGLGAYKGLFDSFYIYGFMTFGISFLLFVFYFIKYYIKTFKSTKLIGTISDSMLVFCFTAFPSMILLMSFQHVAGSIYYTLNFFILFHCALCNFRGANNI
ncbi:hypothetical protein [Serratia fonticola]|uniref:hypothetical protein n=1 Tax=Serratia fonticola TaxID=47917 RepID=UPI00192A7E34|nr:hypothetical protein [Serratia fonticola]MBL5902090.1 hypothetical protein [Serratia fonticola]